MNQDSKKFLYKLLTTPSPTGFEQAIQAVVKKRMAPYADLIEGDLHGNLIVGLNTKAKRRVMLAGHCDQIGFMVRHITAEGYLYVNTLGGIDLGVLPGSRVQVHTQSGAVPGVIGRKPIHLTKDAERNKLPVDIEGVWIDIGGKDLKEVSKLVTIGDAVTFELGVTELRNDLITAPGLDNRVGLFVAMETLRLCARAKLDVALYSVSTVQEEIGLRGAKTAAHRIDPEVGIAIDVTHASDNPGQDNPNVPPCKLGAGPCIARGPNINCVVEKRLIDASKRAKVPHQIGIASGPLGNDANMLQVSRHGVAAGTIGIPNRYMHSQVEVCSLKDLESSARLLAAFLTSITPRTSFLP